MISPRDAIPAAAVQQLLAAARRTFRPAQDDPATDYPLDRPNRFTRAQLERLGQFADRAAQAAAARLAQMLQTPVTLSPAPLGQHFAASLKQNPPPGLCHVAGVASGQAEIGWIGISATAASQWLARLLGGGGPAEGDQPDQRELSDLERDLLTDIAAGIAEALQKPAAEFGLASVAPERELSSWPQACDADDGDELCLLELAAQPDQPACVAVVLTVAAAAVLAGEVPAAKPQPAKPGKPAAPPTLPHVQAAAVEARAMLSGSLRMCDVMALAAGDVLLLDQKINDAVDLEVDGRPVMRGFPAKQDGCVALRFAEFVQKKK